MRNGSPKSGSLEGLRYGAATSVACDDAAFSSVNWNRKYDTGLIVAFAKLLRAYYQVLIAAIVLAAAIYFIFVSGPVTSCFLGLIIASTLFWIRETHQRIYGLSEIGVGLFVLYQSFPKGRGGFSAGFSGGFQTFEWSVILISTVGAVYIMVRGLDNVFNPRRR
jgi:hypothetical protein